MYAPNRVILEMTWAFLSVEGRMPEWVEVSPRMGGRTRLEVLSALASIKLGGL